jgi:3-dehydroquinate synthetase
MLEVLGLPEHAPAADVTKLMAAISVDKKARRGKVGWVLPRRIGHAEIGHSVPGAVVRRALTRSVA